MLYSSSSRLVVVPSDSITAYEEKGIDWLEPYYNPRKMFHEVFALSPLEKGVRQAYGMTIIGVAERGFTGMLRKLRPDVVRGYGGYWASDLVCSHRLSEIPVVVSVHDTNPQNIHKSVRYADIVICMSNIVAQMVIERGTDPSRVRIMPNHIDVELFHPILDMALLRPLSERFPQGKHILHVGRKSEQKNIDTLIRALPLLPEEYHCIFVGHGDVAPYKALAQSLSVEQRCFWIESIRNSELPLWFSWCDCMCTPSLWEGFGIVFIEAAACGAPIVTSDIAPMNEYLTHDESAYLINEYKNPKALATAILHVCEDDSYRKSISLGAVRVAQLFNRQVVNAQEVAIYHEAMNLGQLPLLRKVSITAWQYKHRFLSLFKTIAPSLAVNTFESQIKKHFMSDPNSNNISTTMKKLRSFVAKAHPVKSMTSLSSPGRALAWLRASEMNTGGIRVHSQHECAYPEVTGYLIPTLLQFGDQELAHRLVRWLIAIQHADGSFTEPDEGISYIFDTGQVLRGLLAAIKIEPLAKEPARRAADYLSAKMLDQGRGGFSHSYHGSIPESVHLYVLPPLIEASVVLEDSIYRKAADNCLKYYISHYDLLRIDDLTHFLAYQMEALIDLGRVDLTLPLLAELQNNQQRDGAVRGMGVKSWVCTPGLAQLAICWYKTGHWEPADKAMMWLERRQTQSGGFLGSYGPGASYFPKVEISWAIKFYLDAHRLRVLSFMERQAAIFPEDITTEDGRLQTILTVVRPGDRIMEVGCGKGRFLKAIKSVQPDTECTGVDISPTMLSYLPAGITKLEGSLEQLPCPEDSFDIAFSVEAIEHSANVDAAVKEMIRITKPGGWVIIVDKQKSAWGQLTCPPWECWPKVEHIVELLNGGCDHVTSVSVSYDGKNADGLMVAWRGQKRSRLTGLEWNTTLLAPTSQSDILVRLRSNQLSPWGVEILLATHSGERVLEIGSGTGEISLALALAGRKVMVMDISSKSLEFTQNCAKALGIKVETLLTDATQPLPLPDNDVDCIWSSGLLEHFTPQERHHMLSDWRRVTRDRVITLVPNAASIAYRAGKTLQAKKGQWLYGLEAPMQSLRQEYAEAGLLVINEFTIGAQHSLNFLPAGHPLRQSLATWMDELSYEELMGCNQGYLLITIGIKQDKTCLPY